MKASKKASITSNTLQLKKRRVFAADGFLCVRRANRIPCQVIGRRVDGYLASVELVASPEACEHIAHCQHLTVQIELADLRLRVRVIGFNKRTRTLLLDALCFFRLIANFIDRSRKAKFSLVPQVCTTAHRD